MILDYTYNKFKKNLSISYITDAGGKKVINFNVDRFKSFYETPTGKYENWNGKKCDVRWTENPHRFDIRTYMVEMPKQYRDLLRGKTAPKLYTFDIETEIKYDENGVDIFTEPSVADSPITVISVVSPDLNCLVLGTDEFDETRKAELQAKFEDYLNAIPFYHELNLKKTPYIQYIHFDSEGDMLEYFLKSIIAKVPIAAGWNSLMYDWQYIQNRIRVYFPNISIKSSSISYTVHQERKKDMRDQEVNFTLPDHTLILDMMDVIENFDQVVMPLKESMSLDYVAHEMLGANKISYEGNLEQLRKTDFFRYVFYNAVDSILVQLLDKRFKTMQNIYMQSMLCNEKIGKCFSKIALSEALVWDYFTGIGKKIVADNTNERERGRLIGAYVKKPIPGKHLFVTCNDFSSLYPNTIRTTGVGFENYIGAYWDNAKLAPFEADKAKYIVIGPNVHINEGSETKPKLGRCIHVFLDEEKLEPYRKDKNYFVSVNGSVYKNDKDYAFRIIQTNLYNERNAHKYLPKELDATVIRDIDHLLKGNESETTYSEGVIKSLLNIGYNISGSTDMLNMSREELSKLKDKIKEEIEYHSSYEQACKLLMNSMYGGSSHAAFFWFNINLANDITGEARNLIHKMEHHIPDFWRENWLKLADVHKMLGIEVDEDKAKQVLENAYYAKDDPDAYQKPSYVEMCYGDTDSVVGSSTIRTSTDITTIKELYNRNERNHKIITNHGAELVETSEKILNYNKDGQLEYQPAKYIMRHKVSKPKWKLKTKTGKEIIVTNDHSLIVFRDGMEIQVKPHEIKQTDKILIVTD